MVLQLVSWRLKYVYNCSFKHGYFTVTSKKVSQKSLWHKEIITLLKEGTPHGEQIDMVLQLDSWKLKYVYNCSLSMAVSQLHVFQRRCQKKSLWHQYGSRDNYSIKERSPTWVNMVLQLVSWRLKYVYNCSFKHGDHSYMYFKEGVKKGLWHQYGSRDNYSIKERRI